MSVEWPHSSGMECADACRSIGHYIVLFSALDNVEVQLYVDAWCKEQGLALVDAGRLGNRENFQFVVLGESKLYGTGRLRTPISVVT